jgi:ATP-dependent DNA helicase PIF1
MGATLDCAYIDFSNVWECGQAYVALSRIKSLQNLYVKNMKASNFKAHPEALSFYEHQK